MTPMPLLEQEMKGGEGGREGGGGRLILRQTGYSSPRVPKEGSARFCLRTSARLSKVCETKKTARSYLVKQTKKTARAVV